MTSPHVNPAYIDQVLPYGPSKWPAVTAAVTGALGSGKSTVMYMLSDMGLPTIDCDTLSRQITDIGGKALTMLSELFGPGVLTDDGRLDRQRMLDLILKDGDALAQLEEIVHPLVFKELDNHLQNLRTKGEKIAVVEVPLLFEAGWDSLFHVTCMVSAPERQCILRIMQRNNVDEETARKWMALQMPMDIKEQQADFIIRNSGTLANLEDQAMNFYRLIEQEADREVGESM